MRKQQITEVSATTSMIASSSEQQHQQMRDELTVVQGMVAHTEQVIVELNLTAKEPKKLATELLTNARTFKV